MAGPATISRAQLVYGLCLPLAALVGFFIAEPMQFSSMVVLGLIFCGLLWPLFARVHHPLLVGAVNSAFMLSFLPGNLPLWMAVALGGFLVVVFRRCLDREVNLFPSGGASWAIAALAAVIVITAYARGGIGLGALGSDSIGGKRYLILLAAIMAYFVVVSRPVPPARAHLYIALYLLSGTTYILSHLVYMAGGPFYWLFAVVDSGPAYGQAAMEAAVQGNSVFRATSGMMVGGALISYLLARYGVLGNVDLRSPWRLVFILLCFAGGMIGGFRSFLVWSFLLLGVMFFMEGLHRTRLMFWGSAAAAVGLLLLFGFSERLPPSMQRSISFLPVKVDPRVKQDAQGSIDWRVEMWKLMWRESPQYALLGKGYVIDPTALQISQYNVHRGFGIRAETALLAGDYHNGPLSILIPFGLWGAAAFVWFAVVAMRRLRWFCRHGSPALLTVNRFLFATFIAKLIFFTFLFGALESDLVGFVMLIALAESINATSPVEAGLRVPEQTWPRNSFSPRGGLIS